MVNNEIDTDRLMLASTCCSVANVPNVNNRKMNANDKKITECLPTSTSTQMRDPCFGSYHS